MLRCRNKREKVEKCGRVPQILDKGFSCKLFRHGVAELYLLDLEV